MENVGKTTQWRMREGELADGSKTLGGDPSEGLIAHGFSESIPPNAPRSEGPRMCQGPV